MTPLHTQSGSVLLFGAFSAAAASASAAAAARRRRRRDRAGSNGDGDGNGSGSGSDSATRTDDDDDDDDDDGYSRRSVGGDSAGVEDDGELGCRALELTVASRDVVLWAARALDPDEVTVSSGQGSGARVRLINPNRTAAHGRGRGRSNMAAHGHSEDDDNDENGGNDSDSESGEDVCEYYREYFEEFSDDTDNTDNRDLNNVSHNRSLTVSTLLVHVKSWLCLLLGLPATLAAPTASLFWSGGSSNSNSNNSSSISRMLPPAGAVRGSATATITVPSHSSARTSSAKSDRGQKVRTVTTVPVALLTVPPLPRPAALSLRNTRPFFLLLALALTVPVFALLLAHFAVAPLLYCETLPGFWYGYNSRYSLTIDALRPLSHQWPRSGLAALLLALGLPPRPLCRPAALYAAPLLLAAAAAAAALLAPALLARALAVDNTAAAHLQRHQQPYSSVSAAGAASSARQQLQQQQQMSIKDDSACSQSENSAFLFFSEPGVVKVTVLARRMLRLLQPALTARFTQSVNQQSRDQRHSGGAVGNMSRNSSGADGDPAATAAVTTFSHSSGSGRRRVATAAPATATGVGLVRLPQSRWVVPVTVIAPAVPALSKGVLTRYSQHNNDNKGAAAQRSKGALTRRPSLFLPPAPLALSLALALSALPLPLPQGLASPLTQALTTVVTPSLFPLLLPLALLCILYQPALAKLPLPLAFPLLLCLLSLPAAAAQAAAALAAAPHAAVAATAPRLRPRAAALAQLLFLVAIPLLAHDAVNGDVAAIFSLLLLAAAVCGSIAVVGTAGAGSWAHAGDAATRAVAVAIAVDRDVARQARAKGELFRQDQKQFVSTQVSQESVYVPNLPYVIQNKSIARNAALAQHEDKEDEDESVGVALWSHRINTTLPDSESDNSDSPGVSEIDESVLAPWSIALALGPRTSLLLCVKWLFAPLLSTRATATSAAAAAAAAEAITMTSGQVDAWRLNFLLSLLLTVISLLTVMLNGLATPSAVATAVCLTVTLYCELVVRAALAAAAGGQVAFALQTALLATINNTLSHTTVTVSQPDGDVNATPRYSADAMTSRQRRRLLRSLVLVLPSGARISAATVADESPLSFASRCRLLLTSPAPTASATAVAAATYVPVAPLPPTGASPSRPCLLWALLLLLLALGTAATGADGEGSLLLALTAAGAVAAVVRVCSEWGGLGLGLSLCSRNRGGGSDSAGCGVDVRSIWLFDDSANTSSQNIDSENDSDSDSDSDSYSDSYSGSESGSETERSDESDSDEHTHP